MRYTTIAEVDTDEVSSKFNKHQHLSVMERRGGKDLMLVFSGVDGLETTIYFKHVVKEGHTLKFFNKKDMGHKVRSGSVEADQRIIDLLEDAGVEIEVRR